MADSSHLDKMAQELKCPICLSLLDSAVSLTCNHVFCKLCIHKSMKSASNCPVCKVHYQCREIRPAPHMDNLVNIYKSMEVASGTPLFVTQNAFTNKIDAERFTDGDLDPVKEKIDEEDQETTVLCRKAETSKRSNLKAKNSARKPSFSMNKRVQVPQSPSSKTPLRRAKEELQKKQMSKRVMDNRVEPSSENLISNGKGNPDLAPFFWLRDDDAEMSSQHSDEDQLTFTRASVPSFSDIKDSDDYVPTKLSPRAPIRKCVTVDLFDSEMFEWTQRPCSPELCPSPLKKQVKESGAYDMCENELDASSIDGVIDKDVTSEQLVNVHLQNKNNDMNKLENESKKPLKRVSKGSIRKQNKRRKINVDKHAEMLNCPDVTNSGINQGQCFEKNSDPGRPKTGGSSKSRTFLSMADKADGMAVCKLPASLGSKGDIKKSNTPDIARRNSKRIKKSLESGLTKTRKEQKLIKADGNREVNASRAKTCGYSSPVSNSFYEESVGDPNSVPEKSNHKNERYCQQVKTKIEKKTRGDDSLPEKVVDGRKYVPAENSVPEVSNNDDLWVPLRSGKICHQTEMPTLRKCNTSSTICAFCLKTEETEATGDMIHYAQGIPVTASHVGDSVIHSHKNCAEWAPNVYFKDGVAVNLEEELTRSRRIKCSLCGLKGAALGCYKKRCCRSFHVPCAKKLKECRWDSDHFVILCPLHVTSKLPNEMCTSQVSQVKSGRRGREGKSLDQRPQLSLDCVNSRWTCARPSEKIVLCGSALKNDEKEAVSEFAQLSGICVSAHWNPSVTHVIASTIQNGACKRTLKVLKGILEGKWILSIQWVHACMKESNLVDETPYEISCDIYGIKNGPLLGRLRFLNKEPKLFSGFKFYVTGDFEPSYIKYLQDLVTTAGGTILHRKPIADNSSSATQTLIIYADKPDKCHPSRKGLTVERRQSDAEVLASSSGSRVAHDKWVFDCIAGHKVLPL